MTLDEVLNSLFPAGYEIERGPFHTWRGTGRRRNAADMTLVGVADGLPLGIDASIVLAGHVLSMIEQGGDTPMLMLVDAGIQNMTRRDELLGLNEYFGHLCKAVALAALRGHRTIALLYGPAAGGALIATALATQVLATVTGAEPSVMDLPSISRVTKLPLAQLTEMAKSTPIFAPGVQNLFLTGAVTERWDAGKPLADQLARVLEQAPRIGDQREAIGFERKGRLLAAEIARRVVTEASQIA